MILPETNSSPLKIDHSKMETNIPNINFQVLNIRFREDIAMEIGSSEGRLIRDNPHLQEESFSLCQASLFDIYLGNQKKSRTHQAESMTFFFFSRE